MPPPSGLRPSLGLCYSSGQRIAALPGRSAPSSCCQQPEFLLTDYTSSSPLATQGDGQVWPPHVNQVPGTMLNALHAEFNLL